MTKELDELFGTGLEPEESPQITRQTVREPRQTAKKPRAVHKGAGKKPAANGLAHNAGEPETSMVPGLEADARKAVAFLKAFDPEGWHALAMMEPGTDRIEAKSFAPGSWGEIEAAIAWASEHAWNCYFYPNMPRPRTPMKVLEKTDIGVIRAVYVDLDVKAHGGAETIAAGKKALLAKLEALPTPPTIINDTGNGLQALWLLGLPLPADDANAKQAWTIGQQLAKALDGDAIQNISRFLRLPWTVNYPNADKQARGRVPILASCLRMTDRRFSLSEVAGFIPPPPAPVSREPTGAASGALAAGAPDSEPVEISEDEASALEDELTIIGGSGASTYRQLPQPLRQRFEALRKRHPKLDALWRKGNGRRDGSGNLMSLAAIIRRTDDDNSFGVLDFRDLVSVWRHAAGHKGLAANSSPRSVARAWLKAVSLKQRADDPRGAFEVIEDAPSPEPSDVAASETRVVEPVDLWAMQHKPLALPAGLLPTAIETFAQTMATVMGADPAGLAMSALAVSAAVISDDIKLQVFQHSQAWLERACIWVGLVGDPSVKKSPMLSAAVAPLLRLDVEMWEAWQKQKTDWETRVKRAKAVKSVEALEPPPGQKRLRLDDTTIEAAQEVMKASPDGVLCYYDEMSGWFGSMDRYAQGNTGMSERSFWLRVYDGGSYTYNRVQRGSGLIRNASACVLGGIQPEPMRKIVEASIDDGLIQRMLPIILEPGGLSQDVAMPAIAKDYDALIRSLHALRPPLDPFEARAYLSFDDEAWQIREELEAEHLDLMELHKSNNKLVAALGKRTAVFARLCVVWHCIENAHHGADALPAIIPGSVARRVRDFVRTFLHPHLMSFYLGTLDVPEEHLRLLAVAGFILARGLQEVTARDVRKCEESIKRLRVNDIKPIFGQLDMLGWVTPVPSPGVRETRLWLVNPEVHARFAQKAKEEDERRQEVRRRIAAAGARGMQGQKSAEPKPAPPVVV